MIVSSCAGSDMSPRVVLLLGACNILADALAMGVGEYLSTKSSDEFASYERTREDWEMRHNPEGEILEMVDIYVGRGMSREDATTVITTMAKYHDFFVNVMMVEELGLAVPEPEAHCDAMKDGFLMFLAFCVFGAFPLLGYALLPQFRPDAAPSGMHTVCKPAPMRTPPPPPTPPTPPPAMQQPPPPPQGAASKQVTVGVFCKA